MIHIKSLREIEKMKDAGKVVAEALAAVGEAVKEGITTAELDHIANKVILKHGAIPSFKGYNGFPASACISVDTEVVHGIPSKERVLKSGSIVSVDIGAIVDGWHGDAARTFPVGEISPEAERLLRVTKESFFAGAKEALPNKRLFDISAAIQEHVEKNGYSVVRTLTGHGIGSKLHEDPEVPNYGRRGHGIRLVPGMALAVEPMVNAGRYPVRTLSDQWTVVTADGSLSAHYENTLIITKGEPMFTTLYDE